MTTLAIVEPHRLTRLGIEQLVTRLGKPVIASVGTMAELGDTEADVILVGPTAAPQQSPDVHTRRGVLVMIDPSTSIGLMRDIRAGVGGFVTQDVDETELLNAIEAVAHGALYLAAGLMPRLTQTTDEPDGPEPARGGLARREAETLRLIASGYTHSQIARRMGLTEATINTYVKRIRTKLSAGNKAELTRRAIDLGYVTTNAARPEQFALATLGRSA